MRVIRFLTVLVLVAAAALMSGCGSGPVTRARLERSLPGSFANQYVQQAQILGHTGITVASLHPRAQCDKGGPKVADRGPGADWVCFMSWQDPNVPVPDGSAKFELNARSNACYTATGPTKLIGLRTITDSHGAFVDNPVFEFDTCFDPGGSDAATKVVFPPASLKLPTGAATRDATGDVAASLNCTTGPLGCSGTVTAQLGSRQLGRQHYSLAPGGASALRFAAPGGATGRLTLVASPDVGGASPRRSVLVLR